MLLITGATGFLGRALVELALRRGYGLRAVARDPERVSGVLPPEVDVVAGDVCDDSGLERTARGCSAVLHLAATVDHSPRQTWRTNVEGTGAVLRAAARAGVPRVVCTGSAAALVDTSGLVAERRPACADRPLLDQQGRGGAARRHSRGRRDDVVGHSGSPPAGSRRD